MITARCDKCISSVYYAILMILLYISKRPLRYPEQRPFRFYDVFHISLVPSNIGLISPRALSHDR